MLPDDDPVRSGGFGDELLELGIDNVFARLWGRDGLSRRDRSRGIVNTCGSACFRRPPFRLADRRLRAV
ncbi:hypothetical protein ACAG25_12450, partial [Mycobacterium sp. pV006]